MSKLKKKINSIYNQAYDHQTNLDGLKQELNILPKHERNLFMKTKKLFILSMCSLIIIAAVIVLGCSLNRNNPQNDATIKDSVITMELNPSISLTVDEKGIVTSVYGNNDEGKMILIDEEENIVGKEAETAMDKILEIEVKCGYFVKDSTDEQYNNLKITVNCELDTNELNAMVQQLNDHVTSKLNELNVHVNEKVEIIKNNEKEHLVNLAVSLDPELTIEAANQLTNQQLIAKISASYLELEQFPTKELENMYNTFKTYEVNLAESKFFNNVLSASTTINTALIDAYNSLYVNGNAALDSLKEAYFNAFIADDSSYQKAYNEILTIKAEVLKLRTEVEALEDGLEKTQKQLMLSMKETALLSAQTALETAKELAATGLNLATTSFNSCMQALDSYILTNEELKTLMTDNANQISQKVNEEKAKAFEHFEANHKDQLTNAYNQLKAHKQLLIDQLNEYSTNE